MGTLRQAGAAARCYERVTVYCPQPVNWIVTVEVAPFRVTVRWSVPESNFGRTVQLAL